MGRTGTLKLENRRIGVSSALAGWHVGLKPLEVRRYSVWFGPLCLGRIDLDSESFQVAGKEA